jgi:hypothetical protein
VTSVRSVIVVAALATISGSASAQSTQDLINRGVAAYTNFQVETAQPLFRQVVSSGWLSPVSAEQRVTAYKYLGAGYAVLGQSDSARIFFSAALEFDPFTDLEQEIFSASEQGPFQLAKQSIFNIGAKPIREAVVNPRNDSTAYRFIMVSTHRAAMKVELIRQPDSTLRETLFEGPSDGIREVRWDGFMRSTGRIADSANYVLRITATSAIPRSPTAGVMPPDGEQLFFRVEHSYEPLEDTLAVLPDSLLLRPAIPPLAPWWDLAKGVGFGATTYLLASAVIAPVTGFGWASHAAIATGVSVFSGVGSFLYRNNKRAIPQNVAENASRQRQRQVFNDGVRARNAARIAETYLIITPITGAR